MKQGTLYNKTSCMFLTGNEEHIDIWIFLKIIVTQRILKSTIYWGLTYSKALINRGKDNKLIILQKMVNWIYNYHLPYGRSVCFPISSKWFNDDMSSSGPVMSECHLRNNLSSETSWTESASPFCVSSPKSSDYVCRRVITWMVLIRYQP